MGANSGTTLAGIGQATSAGAALAGGITQSGAISSQGAFTKSQYNWNSELESNQAADAIQRGNIDAAKKAKAVSATIGQQRAAAGAQGIDANNGSAAKVQSDTAGLGAMDELTIRNNAWRTAFGYKVSALNDKSQGAFAGIAANNNANQTLLTGGMKALTFGIQGASSLFKGWAPDNTPNNLNLNNPANTTQTNAYDDIGSF